MLPRWVHEAGCRRVNNSFGPMSSVLLQPTSLGQEHVTKVLVRVLRIRGWRPGTGRLMSAPESHDDHFATRYRHSCQYRRGAYKSGVSHC